MAVNHGLVGPKSRLKGVGDGQQVNIPALFESERWGDEWGVLFAKTGLGVSSKLVSVGKSADMLSALRGKNELWCKAESSEEAIYRILVPGKTSKR